MSNILSDFYQLLIRVINWLINVDACMLGISCTENFRYISRISITFVPFVVNVINKPENWKTHTRLYSQHGKFRIYAMSLSAQSLDNFIVTI